MTEYPRVAKAAFEFMKHPKLAPWIATIQSDRTRQSYAYELMRLLQAIKKTPDQLLSDLEANPKHTSIELKSHLGSEPSKAVASVRTAALRSFANFYEADLRLNGLKIRAARTRKKPYLTWDQAEKIIAECREPYRSAFRFMLWGGIGVDEFGEIQASAEIQADIEKQRTNNKQYIRIDLRPRKSSLDTYYILVPKEYAPRFPLLSIVYRKDGQVIRGGKPITSIHLEMYWQDASKRAGLRQIGLGPHTLRSAFRSQCGKAGVGDAVAEFQLGHGGRDRYGYSREVEDESYVESELAKLWKQSLPVTTAEMSRAEERIKQLDRRLVIMDLQLQSYIAMDKTKPEKIRQVARDRIEELKKQLDEPTT